MAKARLALLADEAAQAPGPKEQLSSAVSTAVSKGSEVVRQSPWRGVAVALGIGLALGVSRGRGLRAVGALLLPVAGTLGTAMTSKAVRTVEAVVPKAASLIATKTSQMRARASARSTSR